MDTEPDLPPDAPAGMVGRSATSRSDADLVRRSATSRSDPSVVGRSAASLSAPFSARSFSQTDTARSGTSHAERGWHGRGYLPHCDLPGMLQGITLRLHDAVPVSVISAWKRELGWIEARQQSRDVRGGPDRLPPDKTAARSRSIAEAGAQASPAGAAEPPDEEEDMRARQRRELHRRLSVYEDAGHGACHLRHAEIARLVEGALRHFDGERYVLNAWCVMPNHVHTLIRTRERWPIGHVVQSWKRHTARAANRLLGGEGAFWALDYYDRFIRDEAHYWRAVDYIHHNPVKAGLCVSALDWEWSSAREWFAEPPPDAAGGAGGAGGEEAAAGETGEAGEAGEVVE